MSRHTGTEAVLVVPVWAAGGEWFGAGICPRDTLSFAKTSSVLIWIEGSPRESACVRRISFHRKLRH